MSMNSNLQESYLNLASELFPPSKSSLNPLVIERGEGPFLYDVTGRKYIDFATGIGIAPLGHCHPKVVSAILEQCNSLVSSMNVFLPRVKIELAQKLASILPGDINSVFLCNSGTEGIEGALKLARKARPGRPNFLAFNGGFHGRSFGALSVTGSKSTYKKDFYPLLPNCFFVDYPYQKSLDETMAQIEELFEYNCPPSSLAAIIVEPVLGEGGYFVPPVEFLQNLRRLCDRWDILLIADEVQTGFGRTGKWFACEHSSVEPDIIAFAKGIASGLPLGGFAAKKELMKALEAGSHGTTFGGNPVSCAASLATIKVIESEGLLERASSLGKKIVDDLNAKFGQYLDIRGLGFMIGIEPKPDMISFDVKSLVKRIQSKGLIVYTCGKDSGVIRMMPPLNIQESILSEGLSYLEQVLDYEILMASEYARYKTLAK